MHNISVLTILRLLYRIKPFFVILNNIYYKAHNSGFSSDIVHFMLFFFIIIRQLKLETGFEKPQIYHYFFPLSLSVILIMRLKMWKARQENVSYSNNSIRYSHNDVSATVHRIPGIPFTYPFPSLWNPQLWLRSCPVTVLSIFFSSIHLQVLNVLISSKDTGVEYTQDVSATMFNNPSTNGRLSQTIYSVCDTSS